MLILFSVCCFKVFTKDANEYTIIRIPNTILIVNLTFEYSFVLIKYAYRT